MMKIQFILVALILFLYMVGILGILPIFSQYLVTRRCREMKATDCGSADVTASASQWYMWAMVSVNFGSFLTAAYVSSLSDRYGRRPIILMQMIGYVAFWATGLFVILIFDLGLIWICLMMFVTGLFGGMGAMLSVCFSIAADQHIEEERPSRFAILSAIGVYLSGMLGPLIFGQLVGVLDIFHTDYYNKYHLSFLVNWAISAVMCLITSLFLKESLISSQSGSDEKSFMETIDGQNVVGDKLLERQEHTPASCQSCLTSYCELTFGTAKILLRFRSLLFMFALLFLGQSGLFGIIPIYAKLSHFGLNSKEIGYLVSASSLGQFIVIFFILSPILSRIQSRHNSQEEGLEQFVAESSNKAGSQIGSLLLIARIGAVLMAMFLVLDGLAYYMPTIGVFTPKISLFAVAIFGSLSPIWDPCLRSSLSISASECGEDQGNVLGGLALLQTLMNLVAPFAWNGLYSATANWNPAFCFYIGSGVALIAIIPSFLPQAKPIVNPHEQLAG